MAYSNPSLTTPLIVGAGAIVRQFVLSTVGSTSLVTAPAAGATITWLQVPQDGEYSVQLAYGVSGVPLSTRNNNVRLQVDATTVTSLILQAGVATSASYQATVVLKVTSQNWIALNVITGDAAQYVGSILATRMS